jgi:LmbE family N-acetylglucosaminyl deacetylase
MGTLFLVFALVCSSNLLLSQPNSAKILADINRLSQFGRVMYLAAHPDDENTRMISYLSHGRGFMTCYLSLTRGDGGQNLIGKEQGIELGIIRTQELVEARKIDGAMQFFTRAYDFGYSKRPEETLELWNKDEVLFDMVKVIRDFKPDVIITRFSPAKMETHGHHTASAMLALEAVDLAADTSAFKELLPAWKVRRVFWNTSSFFYRSENFDKTGLLTVDVGGYSPLLGQSFGELAALSRSKHRSQGFGAAMQRGSNPEYLKLLKGDSCKADFMEGIDTSWLATKGGLAVQQKIAEITRAFNFMHPEWSIGRLIELYQIMEKLPEDERVEQKMSALEQIIANCAGLHLEARAENYITHLGKPLNLTFQALNRSSSTLSIEAISFPGIGRLDTVVALKNNALVQIKKRCTVPSDLKLSQPYWLSTEPQNNLFVPTDKDWVGLAENPEPLEVEVAINFIKKKTFKFSVPLRYVWVEPDKGEMQRKVEILPLASLEVNRKNLIFNNQAPQVVTLQIKNFVLNFGGRAKIDVPENWLVLPEYKDFFIEGQEPLSLDFEIFPLPQASSFGEAKVKIISQETTINQEVRTISYDHIFPQTYFLESKLNLIRINLNLPALKIGYIEGAGDGVADALKQLGIEVTQIDASKIKSTTLQNFDAIILGIRAFNVSKELVQAKTDLMAFVEQGGTLIVQYNTENWVGKLLTQQIGPFPFKIGRDRVTDEKALVSILDTTHQAFNYPNKISSQDFEGWVQERGLYFATDWDSNYTPLLSMSDPTESPKLGSTLVAQYGKGNYVYTGLSFFRQLPAGVPGAYRLFVNMLFLSKKSKP